MHSKQAVRPGKMTLALPFRPSVPPSMIGLIVAKSTSPSASYSAQHRGSQHLTTSQDMRRLVTRQACELHVALCAEHHVQLRVAHEPQLEASTRTESLQGAPRKLQATWFMYWRASRESRPSTMMWNCS